MLNINNLTVKMNDKIILENFSLSLPRGQVHALMGPNGSGKSTLAYVLAGKPEYEVIQGTIVFNDIDILPLKPEERSFLGLFLALQYPVEIPGVNNSYFIKSIVNAQRKHQGKTEMDAVEFLALLQEKLKVLNMPDDLSRRALNEGFSGGEKKCNEILQLLMLEPQFAILDETDSGLDVDTLKRVSHAINSLKNNERSILLITHYQRILNYITPDKIHIMVDGKIVMSGDQSLAQELENKGYAGLIPAKKP